MVSIIQFMISWIGNRVFSNVPSRTRSFEKTILYHEYCILSIVYSVMSFTNFLPSPSTSHTHNLRHRPHNFPPPRNSTLRAHNILDRIPLQRRLLIHLQEHLIIHIVMLVSCCSVCVSFTFSPPPSSQRLIAISGDSWNYDFFKFILLTL